MSLRRPAILHWSLALTLCPALMGAQASPYLPGDDPRRPLLEHLIARGDLRDPAPLDRPLRRADLVAALAGRADPLSRRLLTSFGPPLGRQAFALTFRGGGQGFTQGRRDLLHEGGDGGVKGYAEAAAEAGLGPLVFVARGAAENRLRDDPDWPDPAGAAAHDVVVRVVEAYAALQFRWGALRAGQMARNWGPQGVTGIAIGDADYPRPDLELDLGTGALRYSGVATRLMRTDAETASGIERYFIAHRLTYRFKPTLTLAAWETGMVAGPPAELDGKTRAIVPLLVVPALVASRRHRNEMVGGGFSWRPASRWRLEGELAIDDWNFDANNPYPQRWAAALSAAGALGARASWSASWSTASSLAFHTLNRAENFTDRGVGIGRLFPDNEVVSVSIGLPLRETWLLSPRAALLRQGEGRLGDPFPTAAEAANIPARFIGTVEKSLWIGAGVAGWEGPFALTGEAGLRHRGNAGQTPGANRTEFAARLSATMGITFRKIRP